MSENKILVELREDDLEIITGWYAQASSEYGSDLDDDALARRLDKLLEEVSRG